MTHTHSSWAALDSARMTSGAVRDAAAHARRSIELGEQIRRLRRAQGWSQAELATRAHTSQAAIARIELGDVDPKVSTLERLSTALGADLVISLRAPEPVG